MSSSFLLKQCHCVPGSSYLDGFRDGNWVAVLLLFYFAEMLLFGFVQYSSLYSYAIAV